ncbi:hypothetical protein LTS17_005988 [Exophiala oligosperma]
MPTTQLVVTTLQATALSAASNILAQLLKAYRENDFLEDRFPGYTSTNIGDGGASPSSSDKIILDRSNTARKLLFDQTLGAFVNTIAFIAAMAAFKGKTAKAVQKQVERVNHSLPSISSCAPPATLAGATMRQV